MNSHHYINNSNIETNINNSHDILSKSTNCNEYEMESSNDNVNELFEILSEKIKNIEVIDEFLINEIYKRLKLIRKNHNNKILTWYDEKFYNDLDNFKKNNDIFCKLMKFNEKNSYVLVNNDM